VFFVFGLIPRQQGSHRAFVSRLNSWSERRLPFKDCHKRIGRHNHEVPHTLKKDPQGNKTDGWVTVTGESKQGPPQTLTAFRVIKCEKSDKTNKVSNVLTNGVADRSSTSVLFGQHSQCPSIQINILRRREEIQDKKEGCLHTDGLAQGVS
jgi:hypothetical protein